MSKYNAARSNRLLSIAVVIGLGLAVATSASAAATTSGAKPASAATQTSVSVEPRFNIGSLLVERHGEQGSPVILVPGLASGAWVWEETVRQLQGKHVVYVVTLAGFNGTAPVSGKVMQQALQSLKGLIVTQQLVKPAIVGHSLGGVLAIALAENESSLVSGVVSIDGLPIFPGTEAIPAAQRPAMVASITNSMRGMSKEAFVAQQLQYMRGIGVLDGSKAEKMAKLSSRSDPGATAEYMAETLALDLRPNLPKITVPVLLISPYNAGDGAQQKMSEQGKADYYRTLMAGTPNLKVVSVAPARHFAMFDQPVKVGDAIGTFLDSLAVPQ